MATDSVWTHPMQHFIWAQTVFHSTSSTAMILPETPLNLTPHTTRSNQKYSLIWQQTKPNVIANIALFDFKLRIIWCQRTPHTTSISNWLDHKQLLIWYRTPPDPMSKSTSSNHKQRLIWPEAAHDLTTNNIRLDHEYRPMLPKTARTDSHQRAMWNSTWLDLKQHMIYDRQRLIWPRTTLDFTTNSVWCNFKERLIRLETSRDLTRNLTSFDTIDHMIGHQKAHQHHVI